MAPSLDEKPQPSNYGTIFRQCNEYSILKLWHQPSNFDTVVPRLRNQKHGVVAESTAVPKIASTQYSLYILVLTHLIATALVSMSMSKSKSQANKGPIIKI